MRLPIIEKTRKNHALEHATVAALIERGARAPLGGYSLPRGFVIWSRASREDVESAAESALCRLNAGRSELAISPYCGTNLAAGALIGALAAAIVGRGGGFWAKLRGAAAGVLAASALSQPVGKFIQRRFTTLSELSGAEITAVRTLASSRVNVVWVGVDHAGALDAPPVSPRLQRESSRRAGVGS